MRLPVLSKQKYICSYEDEIRSVEGPGAGRGGPENDYDPFAELGANSNYFLNRRVHLAFLFGND